MTNQIRQLSITTLLLTLFGSLLALGADSPQTKEPPKVLIIGDSISIGYTPHVKQTLLAEANVVHNKGNAGPTENGLKNIDEWIGTTKWDVIHFNWGLHDLKVMPDGQKQVSPEAYQKNLRELVRQLKATGARLIWANTTPVPAGKLNPPRGAADVSVYNAIAKRIMDENRIATDDLYSFALPQLSKIQRPENVHFTAEGSETLAKQVVGSIESGLPTRN